MRILSGLAGLALVLAVVALSARVARTADPGQLPGIQASEAPWPAERTLLVRRLDAIGLPALAEEGTALHTHQHLDVFIAGRRIPVPEAIGIGLLDQYIAPIHTHDGSGIIHVESPTVETFTLGQFFDVWGVRLDARCIGAYCERGTRQLRVYSNGARVGGDPRALPLTPHEVIVVTYGTPEQLPRPIPSRYEFPPGL